MKAIRFRAWNGEYMEYGGFSVHATSGKVIASPLTRVTEDSPVMQYTGVDDKNGRPIYEGDILRAPMCFGPAGFHEREFVCEFHPTQGYQWNYIDLSEAVVIGHKYQAQRSDDEANNRNHD